MAPIKSEIVDSEGVITSFFRVGSHKIELVNGDKFKQGPIQKYLITIEKECIILLLMLLIYIRKFIELKKDGIRLLNDKPKIGADNK